MGSLLNKTLFLFLILAHFSLVGQEFQKDTSYTIHSAYHKLVKKYPNISIAKSGVQDLVKIDRDIVYKSIGKRDLVCDVYRPIEVKGSIPGVLLIHGGGWKTGDKQMMKALAEKIAAEGYLVVCPEYRLSAESTYPAAVIDLFSAIRWMRKERNSFGLNPEKIAVAGCSAGGQLAALMGSSYKKNIYKDNCLDTIDQSIQLVVDIDGVLAFKHPMSEEGKMASDWLGGNYEAIPGTWEEASAMFQVNESTPPTLFIGSSYPRFLAGREEYQATLKEFGIPSEFKAFSDAPHSFWLMNPWFEPTMNWVIGFMNEQVKNNK